jgi:hypothetical protein
MSQRDVERTLGRLLTDAGFRRDFFHDPARACLALGVQLARHEVEALLRVPRRRLTGLSGKLDDRICRLDIERPAVESDGDMCRPEERATAGVPEHGLAGHGGESGRGPCSNCRKPLARGGEVGPPTLGRGSDA